MPLPNDALRLSADSVWFFGRSCWGRVPRPVVPLLRDHRGHACLHLAADPPERHLGGYRRIRRQPITVTLGYAAASGIGRSTHARPCRRGCRSARTSRH